MKEIIKIRSRKADKLRELKINPYVSKPRGSRISIRTARKKMGKTVFTAGRLMGFREHGNIAFADLKDETGDIQLLFAKKELSESFKIVKLLDIGDFVWIKGEVTKTQAGETTIKVGDVQILTKTIRPLPSTWHGLKDEEKRYRKRYIDLLLNDDLKDLFVKKAIFWQTVRKFMIDEGFLEVETPVLEVSAGGADAVPFVTHHSVLNTDLYLRISMGELWQKRLMVAGFEKTFEIGRQFRNEGISREHLQDYTQMEFYWAYADFEDSMKLVEELYKKVAQETFGTLEFKINGMEIDMGGKWEKIDYRKVIIERTEIDIEKVDKKELIEKIKSLKLEYKKTDGKPRLIDIIWKSIRKEIAGPAFLVGHPVEVSPLAKRQEKNPDYVERYQIILAGSEMGNGYSELNDPIDQRKRFEKQQKMRDEGDLEAQMHDENFVVALEYGMPPVTGFGVSERLFSFLADKPIRETVLFPLLRPEGNDEN